MGFRGANLETSGLNADNLARTICAAVLAGELSLLSALASECVTNNFSQYLPFFPPISFLSWSFGQKSHEVQSITIGFDKGDECMQPRSCGLIDYWRDISKKFRTRPGSSPVLVSCRFTQSILNVSANASMIFGTTLSTEMPIQSMIRFLVLFPMYRIVNHLLLVVSAVNDVARLFSKPQGTI